MSNRSVIGITADRSLAGIHWSQVVGEKYINAIVDGSQGLALLLPALGERQSAADILSAVDGLLFTGSYSNVEPHLYGGAPSLPGTLHDAARDATTLPLLRAAVAQGVPLLAICRGFQELNVAFGGSLHQRVHEVAGLADHREDKSQPLAVQYGPAHGIQLSGGGVLATISGLRAATVNSVHGQGLDRLGAGLQVEAVAPDGLVEAVSVRDAPAFALGVQWHPEWRHAEDTLSSAIFRAFGDACRARRLARGLA
ncbi:gamma-glutamyl-gamma-aminobutyrate hydrolase family protein [Vogesella facilis]|uniref:Gamma-glutamyl-gamma-aminobutyrate hydrolase family protein n=1 Tax=Vogesella facilis TaxID=1655232 RepID=A0ABV7RGC1_9NEIS